MTIIIVKPVHLEGTLIGWAVTTAHHGDVGGRLPGSSACDNTEIYQEGLRMPWLRFYSEGEPDEAVHKLIEANMRIPRVTFGDLGAQVAACSVAERALQALATRHGSEQLASLMLELIDYTERLMRQEILTWPDGTAIFTDYLGSDGVEARDVPIVARVTIAGDEVIADLTESSPMVQGSLNSTRSFVMACVYQAIRCALTLEIPNTAGAFKPVTVLTKPGTVAEVVMPGASSMRGVTGFRILDALNGALAQLIPGRIPAAEPGGTARARLSCRAGGSGGARRARACTGDGCGPTGPRAGRARVASLAGVRAARVFVRREDRAAGGAAGDGHARAAAPRAGGREGIDPRMTARRPGTLRAPNGFYLRKA